MTALAARQIRSTFSAIINPSNHMMRALGRLGYESGEEIIIARGFRGALQSLLATTDGTISSILRLFPASRT